MISQTKRILLALCLIPLLSSAERAGESDKPNLVFILADDLGYGDLGCYGNSIHHTPHIDQLASEGALFTDYYVTSPVCTPTRMALMTGKHPAHFKAFGVIWPPTQGGLPTEEVTIAEWLGDHGYATGLAGKWHLGHSEPDLLPLAQGFDSWYGMPYPNDMGPFHPQTKWVKGEWPPMPMFRDHEIVEAPVNVNLLTQQYHAESVRFIAENHHRPFFLMISHAMPHTIIGASSRFKGKSKNGLYGDAVEELDWSVGKIIQTLDDFNLREKTLIIFTSDNGAALPKGDQQELAPGWRLGGSNAPFSKGKGSTFEGGVRVPAIFSWPGTIQSGAHIKDPCIITDTIATFAEMANLSPPCEALESISIAPVLQGKPQTESRALFFGSGDARSVRKGKWKYHLTNDPAWKKDYKTEPMLFDLENDPAESMNVVKKFPEIAEILHAEIKNFNQRILKP